MLVDYDSSYVRLALRAYFLISAALLALVGNQCCKAAVKVDLCRGRKVRLHRLTGWLSGFSFIASLWDLAILPAGVFLGVVMIIGIFIEPVADLAVSGLVHNVQVPARCDFVQGMVLHPSPPFNFTGPPVNGQPRNVAMSAQLTSVQNGGLQGAYWKVNSDPKFYAQPQDVFGGWHCANVNDDLRYSPDTAVLDVIQDLIDRGYLYPNFTYISQGPSFGYEHLVAWSSSSAQYFLPFDIKVSIDASALTTDDFLMRSFYCSVPNNVADNILASLDTNWTFKDWIQDLQGGCYYGSNTPARAAAGTYIEQYLNSLLMVQAGRNDLLQKPPHGSDTTQGCLTTRTDIPTAIFGLVGTAGALLLILVIDWIWLLALLAYYRSGRYTGALGFVPSGLTSWMLHAARESAVLANAGQPRSSRRLKEWRYMVIEESFGGEVRGVAKLVDGRGRGEAGIELQMGTETETETDY